MHSVALKLTREGTPLARAGPDLLIGMFCFSGLRQGGLVFPGMDELAVIRHRFLKTGARLGRQIVSKTSWKDLPADRYAHWRKCLGHQNTMATASNTLALVPSSILDRFKVAGVTAIGAAVA